MKFTSGLLIVAICYMPYLKRADATDEAPLGYPVADRLVRCRCSPVYDPVCGSDGNDYPNECYLRCVSFDNIFNRRPAICVRSLGLCPTVSCNCAKIVKPVCGIDGQTYANECLLQCENSRRALFKLAPIKIDYLGTCGDAPCICPDAVIPVCGTDGKTYRNVCVWQCKSRILQAQGLPQVGLGDIGACKTETCICPTTKNELCANDGVTYYNQCALDCVNRKREQLGQEPLITLYPGPCISCPCAAVEDPVCASDGNTYANACKLDCENQKRKRLDLPALKLLFKGQCGCICSKEYRPLCASDHRTKGNYCLLICENEQREAVGLPPLEVLYEGECDPCDCGYCSSRWRPVCGSDWLTYWNICWFNCNNDCRAAYGLRPIKKIADTECY